MVGEILFILFAIVMVAFLVWFIWFNITMCRMVEGVESMSDEVLDGNLRREGFID